MKKKSISVIGAGSMGLTHIRLIQGSGVATLNSLVDSSFANPNANASATTPSSLAPQYTSIQEMLTRETPDAIIIATPNALHVEQALACVQAGIPVLVEKPIATSTEDAQRLVDAVSRTGAKVLIGHHRAHSPIMLEAVNTVRSGALGRVVCVTGSALFHKPSEYFAQARWRTEPGGGPVLINMIHEVHNLRMLCGEITQVQAMSSNAIRGFAVEDTVAINFRFSSGALGTFMLSDCAASTHSWEQSSEENKAYAHYSNTDCYALSGSMGTLSIPTLRRQRFAGNTPASWFNPMQEETLHCERVDPLARQLEHFVDLINDQCAPRVSALDGLQNLRVLHAVAQAAQTQVTVHL